MAYDIDAMRALYGQMTGDYDASAAIMAKALAEYRAECCQSLDLCRAAIGMAKGAQKRQYREYARVYHANIMAISDALDPPAPDELGMTDNDILAALCA